MNDKYSRQHFMPIVMGTKLERDLVLNNWDLFQIKRPIEFDIIRKSEIARPDLLSLRIYGNMSYWWILCKVNNIDDVYNDMTIGMDIIIPNVNDISDFVITVRNLMRQG